MKTQLLCLLATGMILVPGCLNNDPLPTSTESEAGWVPVQERHLQPFDLSGPASRPLAAGPYAVQEVQSVEIPVKLPALEAGPDGSLPTAHLGLFLPAMPDRTKVPVLADFSPHYGMGDPPATQPSPRLGGFLVENFVPHGFAVAQVSVLGTGQSGHCWDFMGAAEQAGIDAALTWLGGQTWSNGNVGVIGLGYDGAAAWEAAATGNPHVKTIVPISGPVGAYEWLWRNGTAKAQALIEHVTAFSGTDPAQLERRACADNLAALAQATGSFVNGASVAPEVNSYWAERSYLDRVLASYTGSAYVVHGLNDFNIPPHASVPAYEALKGNRIATKGLFGQWGHMLPDREVDHETLPSGYGREAFPATVRYDWAQDLLEWFSHYLRGQAPTPSLRTEIQDNEGGWHFESTPGEWLIQAFGRDMVTAGGYDVVAGGEPEISGMGAKASLGAGVRGEPLSEDLHLSGQPQLRLTVTPSSPVGQVYALLRHVEPDGTDRQRIGWAIMDLRYAAGGDQMQPVVPGLPLTLHMQFEPVDAVIPAGRALEIYLGPTGEGYATNPFMTPILIAVDESSTLRLPLTGGSAPFSPPGALTSSDVSGLQR